MNIMHVGGWLALELPVRGRALVEIATQLEEAGKKLERSYAARRDTAANRRLLNHVIGIERWGQSRLRVALGDPLIHEEYDGYRPPRDTDWPELQALFQATRAETVGIGRELAASGGSDAKIPHNQYGDLSTRGWLRYLNLHANIESRKLR